MFEFVTLSLSMVFLGARYLVRISEFDKLLSEYDILFSSICSLKLTQFVALPNLLLNTLTLHRLFRSLPHHLSTIGHTTLRTRWEVINPSRSLSQPSTTGCGRN